MTRATASTAPSVTADRHSASRTDSSTVSQSCRQRESRTERRETVRHAGRQAVSSGQAGSLTDRLVLLPSYTSSQTNPKVSKGVSLSLPPESHSARFRSDRNPTLCNETFTRFPPLRLHLRSPLTQRHPAVLSKGRHANELSIQQLLSTEATSFPAIP